MPGFLPPDAAGPADTSGRHAIVGANALDPFEQRILDLQTVEEADTPAAIAAAAERLGSGL